MQESILCNFVKIWSFYPKSRNFSCFVTLKMIVLVRAINKCFQKYVYNVKTYYKLLNMNVNLTAKVSKTALKYIEFLSPLECLRMALKNIKNL